MENAVLKLGDFQKQPDRDALYHDLSTILQDYVDTDITNVDVAQFFQEVIEAMKRNGIRLPHGLAMLARGLIHMEGDLAEISPDINMAEIATRRVIADRLENFDWKKELRTGSGKLIHSLEKSVEIPSLVERALRDYMAGEGHMSMELKTSPRLAWLLRKLVQNLVLGIWVMALLIASAILCTSDLQPQVFGMPLLGVIGFGLAGTIVAFLVVRHIITRPREMKEHRKRK